MCYDFMIYGDRLSTDVTVRKLQYRVDTVIRVSTQRKRHNFISLPPYFYFYTCSCRSSPLPGKALALRTDSNEVIRDLDLGSGIWTASASSWLSLS